MANSSKLRAEVVERAGHRCEYCHYPAQVSSGPLHAEHIVPVSAGGETRRSNLALACPHCNYHKQNKVEATDPVTHQSVRLFDPRIDAWHGHFQLNHSTGEIDGKTPIGRATVAGLQMNTPEVMNVRRLLIERGLW